MTEKDLPTEYNEFVRFIEQNDTSVVAQVLSENYTTNRELKDLVESWRNRLGSTSPCREYEQAAKELEYETR